MKPPVITIDPQAFWADPYPALANMRRETPFCYVPQLDAVLITRRDDIFILEKNTEVFSSEQPGGLMTVLMGENMMRKDGDQHRVEKRQMNPSVSPTAITETWHQLFLQDTNQVLDGLSDKRCCDLVADFAMPVSANALRRITGLTNMTTTELDATSQAMIDGIANYAGVAEVERRCNEMTALIDTRIDEMLTRETARENCSLLSTLTSAGQAMDSVRANIKLAISGGQNEPRDAIAGTVWALLEHPLQLEKIQRGDCSWRQAFEEYARWISPIGMSPRRIARHYTHHSLEFEKDQRAFLMFSSGNRDESVFEQADTFDITRNNNKSVSFGAGPHFCAGAWVSRCLIGDVALPLLFERFPDMRLAAETEFGGWAFRGPLTMPVALQ